MRAAIGIRSQPLKHPQSTRVDQVGRRLLPAAYWPRTFVAGLWASLFMLIVAITARNLAIAPHLSFQDGLGSRLGLASSIVRAIAGTIWHLLNGGIFALMLAKAFRLLRVTSYRSGAGLGFVLFYGVSMTMGTLPQLDLWSAPGLPTVGPFGAFGGLPTFYLLLLLHVGFGTAVGWAASTAES